MTVSVILILVMLLLSAFFSGMEIAFVSKNRLKLEIDRKQSGLLDFVAKVFERHPGQYITSILVGNNIALVVYSLYMSSLLRALAALAGWDAVAQGGSVLAETLISTVVIIFVAEYLPKALANPEDLKARYCLSCSSSFTSCSIRSYGLRPSFRTSSCGCSAAG